VKKRGSRWNLEVGKRKRPVFCLSEPRVNFALALRVRVPEAASRPPLEVGMKEADLGRHRVDAVPISLSCCGVIVYCNCKPRESRRAVFEKIRDSWTMQIVTVLCL
jgi:hypothetical protein